MSLPRMRTIDQCIAYTKQIDPDSALTKSALRRMVINGTMPHVNVGKKYLIDLDNLERYLNGELSEDTDPVSVVNGIRKVNR